MRAIRSGLSALAGAGMSVGLATLLAVPAMAQDKPLGQPHPWQLGFQESASPVKHSMAVFHDYLLMPIITVITLFVLGLLIYCMVRFSAKANPVPSKTTHHPLLEVAWTGVPVIILLVIAVPSFKLLYFGDRTVEAGLTVKATGHQWYWSYQYPDQDNLAFDAVMVEEKDLKPGQPRLLTTDTQVVVPINTNVRLLATAGDVIHAWAVPALGVKIDAVPGRVNESWFRAEKEGIYYGQCSELCGRLHGYMPIMVRAVSQADFDAWVVQAKAEHGTGQAAVQVADRAPARAE